MAGLVGEDRSSKDDSRSGKPEGVDALADKLTSLESRIKAGPAASEVEISRSKHLARIAELETEQGRLTRELVDLEESAKNFRRDVEAVENEKSKIEANLALLASDHEELKSKSLELLKRSAGVEGENEVLRREKTLLVDNILNLQRNHQDELNGLRATLESLGDKLYVAGLDSENRQTFTDLEQRHAGERKAWTEKNRNLQETCEQLQQDCTVLEDKIDEQHQVIGMYAKMEQTLKAEQRKLRDLEAEFELLSENYNNLEKERNEAYGRVRELERELSGAKDEWAKSQADIGGLVKVKEDLVGKRADLEGKLEEARKEVEEMERKVRELDQEKRSADKSIAQ